MSAERRNAQVRAELLSLAAQKVISPEQLEKLNERYPVSRFDLASLTRWFSIFGAVAMGAGLIMLAPHLVSWKVLIDLGLAAATAGSLVTGRWFAPARGLPRIAAALELLGALALQGLTVALAAQFSTGSKNWPALVGVDAALLLVLAYLLANRLVLIVAAVNLFFFFGGETGYVSGWGAYWLGMDYPLRFFGAGLVTLGIAYAHARWLTGARQGFARVWAHVGMLDLHLALWFFAVFGYYRGELRWDGTEAQRLGFSVLWALVSVACLWGASRTGLRLLRGYGLTFLTLNAFTFYGQFVAYRSAELWFVHLLVVGGALVGLGMWAERVRLRHRRSAGVDPTA